MLEKVYPHVQGRTLSTRAWSLDEMFEYNVRYQVYCRNHKEKDYLSALQLMYGRELEILCYQDRVASVDNPYPDATPPLPIVFTTMKVDLLRLP